MALPHSIHPRISSNHLPPVDEDIFASGFFPIATPEILGISGQILQAQNIAIMSMLQDIRRTLAAQNGDAGGMSGGVGADQTQTPPESGDEMEGVEEESAEEETMRESGSDDGSTVMEDAQSADDENEAEEEAEEKAEEEAEEEAEKEAEEKAEEPVIQQPSVKPNERNTASVFEAAQDLAGDNEHIDEGHQVDNEELLKHTETSKQEEDYSED